jgi:hypothetical protein
MIIQCANLQQHTDVPDDGRVCPKHVVLIAWKSDSNLTV